MTKDINHVIQEIAKQDKQLHNIDTSLSKDMSILKKDISDLKKYVKTLEHKIDAVLEIMVEFRDAVEMAQDDAESSENPDWTPYNDEEYDREEEDEDEDEAF
jgi:seryl-tRNA synthetase